MWGAPLSDSLDRPGSLPHRLPRQLRATLGCAVITWIARQSSLCSFRACVEAGKSAPVLVPRRPASSRLQCASMRHSVKEPPSCYPCTSECRDAVSSSSVVPRCRRRRTPVHAVGLADTNSCGGRGGQSTSSSPMGCPNANQGEVQPYARPLRSSLNSTLRSPNIPASLRHCLSRRSGWFRHGPRIRSSQYRPMDLAPGNSYHAGAPSQPCGGDCIGFELRPPPAQRGERQR